MKANLSNRGLRNIIVTAFVAGALNVTVQAQPAAEFIRNDEETALADLNHLAIEMKGAIMYKAPVEFVDPAVMELEMLASATMEEIIYKAPDATGNITVSSENHNSADLLMARNPVKVENFRSYNEEWLINAGYYKTERTPAWDKIKKAVAVKNRDRQLASRY